MANSSKNIWIAVVLIAAGFGVFALTLGHQEKTQKPVVMEEVFNQTPGNVQETKKDPVPSPAIITSPEKGLEAGFSVQVYSFQDRARAEKALEDLKSANFKAFMEVSDLGEKGMFYRVRIGPLADEAQAKAILEEVRKDYKSGIIIKPKK